MVSLSHFKVSSSWVQGTGHMNWSFLYAMCDRINMILDVSSNGLPQRMHSHIGCICLAFLHCAFSNVSSSGLLEMRHSRIGCICVTFLLHYWFSQGNININPSFTNIIIFNMLIHHNQVGNVPWKSFSTTSALSPEMRPLSRVSL